MIFSKAHRISHRIRIETTLSISCLSLWILETGTCLLSPSLPRRTTFKIRIYTNTFDSLKTCLTQPPAITLRYPLPTHSLLKNPTYNNFNYLIKLFKLFYKLYLFGQVERVHSKGIRFVQSSNILITLLIFLFKMILSSGWNEYTYSIFTNFIQNTPYDTFMYNYIS